MLLLSPTRILCVDVMGKEIEWRGICRCKGRLNGDSIVLINYDLLVE